jgi:hypothetical protein
MWTGTYIIEECHGVARVDGEDQGQKREEARLECCDIVLHHKKVEFCPL